jgi:hypothetical protein
MMNERIKELAEQAGLDVIFHLEEMGLDGEIELWKFAELIVRECTQIVADAVDHREPASTYASKIQEHFGIKIQGLNSKE